VTQPNKRYEPIRIIETKTGKNLEDPILWTHFGDLEWSGIGGTSTERTDTRVLQVLFEIGSATVPEHPGEQIDVYIKGAP
jgi:hypothetical protein